MNAATDTSPSESPKKYLVAVLYYGPVDREHDRCVKELAKEPLVENVLELTGCPYIDIGRSIAATAVLDNPELGGLLFIDHDMVFDPKEAIATIESAIEADATVGAAYSMRKPGAIIGAVDGSKIDTDRTFYFFKDGERLPANYLGMGMTAIPRSVLVRLVEFSKAKYARQQASLASLRKLLAGVSAAISPDGELMDPTVGLSLLDELVPELRDEDLPRLLTGISDAPVVPFFSLLQRSGYYYGEDVSFCARNHFAGLGVFLDTRVRVYHKGTYCYGLEDVGMEVPFCHQLQVFDTLTPKTAPALFSKNPEMQAALRDHNPAEPTRLPHPESYDPSEHRSALPVGAEAL